MYKMTDISPGIRMGRNAKGVFDIEYESGEQDLMLDAEDAEKIAKYILESINDSNGGSSDA
jgi:hypothetical protein